MTTILFMAIMYIVYLIFNVMIVAAASISVTIQKRVTILDSWKHLRGQLGTT